MTTYYVGSGGNDSNAGTSWALRKLTLNGAEDIPVASGDTVYVGPGVYRELLTCDVSGASAIAYIADVTGQNTDGVGGIVRITGSDNDQTATRANCITGSSKNYRTFRGFMLGQTTSYPINCSNNTNWIVEDCDFQNGANIAMINVDGASQASNTFRRLMIWPNTGGSAAHGIQFSHSSVLDNVGHVVENCHFNGGRSAACFQTARVGGITVKNSYFYSGLYGVYVVTALTVGQTVTVNDCSFCGVNTCFNATATGEITEDYNALYAYATARTNTSTGANSNTYPPIFQPVLKFAGVVYPTVFGQLSEWSPIRAIAGTGEATDDFYGITRPTTSAKKSWGAVQYDQHDRETTTTYGSSAASLKLSDAGYKQFIVPVTAVSTTISVRCYREADYAGTNPTMVIKQPGQSNRTTTDTGSASTWNELTDTFTPSATPPYVIVELQSLNTATSGNYDSFFDSLSVS